MKKLLLLLLFVLLSTPSYAVLQIRDGKVCDVVEQVEVFDATSTLRELEKVDEAIFKLQAKREKLIAILEMGIKNNVISKDINIEELK